LLFGAGGITLRDVMTIGVARDKGQFRWARRGSLEGFMTVERQILAIGIDDSGSVIAACFQSVMPTC
jgi:hypothetical protein